MSNNNTLFSVALWLTAFLVTPALFFITLLIMNSDQQPPLEVAAPVHTETPVYIEIHRYDVSLPLVRYYQPEAPNVQPETPKNECYAGNYCCLNWDTHEPIPEELITCRTDEEYIEGWCKYQVRNRTGKVNPSWSIHDCEPDRYKNTGSSSNRNSSSNVRTSSSNPVRNSPSNSPSSSPSGSSGSSPSSSPQFIVDWEDGTTRYSWDDVGHSYRYTLSREGDTYSRSGTTEDTEVSFDDMLDGIVYEVRVDALDEDGEVIASDNKYAVNR